CDAAGGPLVRQEQSVPVASVRMITPDMMRVNCMRETWRNKLQIPSTNMLRVACCVFDGRSPNSKLQHPENFRGSTRVSLRVSVTEMFRPCIDLHEGKVKQIVGGTLGEESSGLRTNFVSQRSSVYYAELYRR